jgi:hypothetical protein
MDSSLEDDFTKFVIKRVDSVKANIELPENIIALEKVSRGLHATIIEYANLLADRSYKQGFDDAINIKGFSI